MSRTPKVGHPPAFGVAAKHGEAFRLRVMPGRASGASGFGTTARCLMAVSARRSGAGRGLASVCRAGQRKTFDHYGARFRPLVLQAVAQEALSARGAFAG